MNKILVAGSSGIIGSYVKKILTENKYNVIGIGYEKENIPDYFSLDLTSRENVKDFVQQNEKFSVLIFLTGLAHSKGRKKEYDDFYNVNVQTLKNLLEEMKAQGKLPSKIIFSSTVSVYGERYQQDIYEETTPLSPKTPYALTKLKAEEYLLTNFKSISWILRFAPVYTSGFSLNINRRTNYSNYFYRVGKGENKLSLLSICNINKTILGIIENKVPPGIYNVSDKDVYTFNDLLEFKQAKKIIPVPKLFLSIIYKANKIIKNNFVEENSVKLLCDNIYPSDKLRKHVDLTARLRDILE